MMKMEENQNKEIKNNVFKGIIKMKQMSIAYLCKHKLVYMNKYLLKDINRHKISHQGKDKMENMMK